MRWLLIACLLALAGCASLQGSRPAADWAKREQQLQNWEGWQMRGRVAARNSDGEGGQASLFWEQQRETTRLRVAGPFGAGGYELLVEPQRVKLTDSRGTTSVDYAGDDAAERFMSEALGWSFPISSARFWMLGVPDPAVRATREAELDGQLSVLEQRGWRVSFQRYARFDDILLPTRLTLDNPRARLRIVISDWIMEPPDAQL